MRLTHQTFGQQIPEFIREGYPQFIEFLKQYYRFLDQTNSYDVGDALDIDIASDAMIDEFFATYAKDLPNPIGFTKREFLRCCKEFYSSKGTAESFNFLFKSLFNKTAEISTPSDNMLRLSNGNWSQTNSVDIEIISGIPADYIFVGAELNLSNVNGIYFIEITDLTVITPGIKYRVFFKRTLNMLLIENQITEIIVDSLPIFKYKVVKSPSKLNIISGGSGFQVGAVISIPGTKRNTVARVKSLNGTSIKYLEVLEYGYDHYDGDIVFVSPYANKPQSDGYTLTETNSLGVINYTLTISDSVDQFSEGLNATYTQQTGSQYVSLDYVEFGYVVYVESFIQNVDTNTINNGVRTSGLSYSDWLNSRAMIRLNSDMIATQPGKYTDNKSLISEPSSRIQDSKYYQIYSYLIDSEVDEKDYKQALAVIHPAGLARFGQINKTNYFDSSAELYVDSVTHYTVMHNEQVIMGEQINKILVRQYDENATIIDAISKEVTIPVTGDTVTLVTETAVYSLPTAYASEIYFSEDYNLVAHTLSIS